MEKSDMLNAKAIYLEEKLLKSIEECSNQRPVSLSQYLKRYVNEERLLTQRSIALFIAITCCSLGSPITLLCTIPAYIFADKGVKLAMKQKFSQARKSIALCVILSTAGVITGIIIGATLFYYIIPFMFKNI